MKAETVSEWNARMEAKMLVSQGSELCSSSFGPDYLLTVTKAGNIWLNLLSKEGKIKQSILLAPEDVKRAVESMERQMKAIVEAL